MKEFVILPRAKADLRTTARYYDIQTSGLGKQFLADFEETIARVVEFPLAAPVVHKSARKARLHDFKFDIFYLLDERKVVVFAVMHQRRHPSSWKQRI